jgi:hypothetical protein
LNFSLANWNLPAIIWCFVTRTGMAIVEEIDVSVSVRYRAFVLAAPQHFAAENFAAECRGAVSVGVVSQRAATPVRKFFTSF